MAPAGFGRGIALILAKEHGCTVYATARPWRLQDLADQATIDTLNSGARGKVVPCQVDQKDDAAVKAFVEDVTAKEEGKIDLLVNSAFQGLVAHDPAVRQDFLAEAPVHVRGARWTTSSGSRAS